MTDDTRWLEWIAIQKQALKAQRKGDLEQAAEIVRSFLQQPDAEGFRCEALDLLALFHQERGELKEARDLLTQAVAHAPEGSYRRYASQLALAGTHEALSDMEGALEHYRQALETASQDETTSAGAALLNFVRLHGQDQLSTEDRRLIERCIRQAWRLFKLQGEPEFEDLTRAAKSMIHAGSTWRA